MTDPAGRLSDKQLALLLRHMPIGLSVADETDVVIFWTTAGFDTVERGQHGSERIIYTAPRDATGVYRGVLETVVPLTEGE